MDETFSGLREVAPKTPEQYKYKGFDKPTYSKQMKKMKKLFK